MRVGCLYPSRKFRTVRNAPKARKKTMLRGRKFPQMETIGSPGYDQAEAPFNTRPAV
jgi:hypothetical protein